MSNSRLIRIDRCAYYHCVSRVVDRRFIFGDAEKSYFSHWMRRLEEFCGVEVATWCLMSNHFHILVKIPEKARQPKLTAESLLKLLPAIYRPEKVREIAEELEQAAQSGDPRWTEQILESYEARRFNLSVFIKELKQRFSRWYNRRTERKGTLWEEKFRSVLVEDSERALLAMAAYIDLNPARGGLAKDPKDYRWCGYGEACGGVKRAREGIIWMLADAARGRAHGWGWEDAAACYRLMLFEKGEEQEADPATGRGARIGLSAEAVKRELARGGKLSLGEALRCRVRYFTDGMALGSAEFLEEVFQENRERFGPARENGARRMRGADWGGLRTLRDLSRGLGG